MSATSDRPDSPGASLRYDLEELAAKARSETAYNEAVRVRVTQEDIRKLMDKRRKPRT